MEKQKKMARARVSAKPQKKKSKSATTMEAALEAASAEFNQLMADVKPAIACVDKLFAAPIASKCYIASIDEDRDDGTIFRVVFAGSYGGPFSFSTGSDVVTTRVSISHLMHKPADTQETTRHKNRYLDDYIALKLKTFMRLFHAALNDDDDQYVSLDRILDLIE
jgi:hypothetical protein